MAIKIGSMDVNDIQVNLDGTLTPVNIVKIGGAATNLWARNHTTTGRWTITNGPVMAYNESMGAFYWTNTYIETRLWYDTTANAWNYYEHSYYHSTTAVGSCYGTASDSSISMTIDSGTTQISDPIDMTWSAS